MMMASAAILAEVPAESPCLPSDAVTGAHARSDGFAAAIEAATAVAREHAASVDEAGRFPAEAVAAMREHGLLGMGIPREFGGGGATLQEMSACARALGTACSSSAMIFAMHQSQLLCLTEHAPRDGWYRDFLRAAAERQYLVASATSEEKIGGSIRTSNCAVETDGDAHFRISKSTPTISYGAYADAILVTARRTSDSPAADQVFLTVMRDDLSLAPTTGWNTLGMRGTCSGGFMLEGRGEQAQILETPFAFIAARTMLPLSHILWSRAWAGIAADAIRRGQLFYRKQVRANASGVPQAGARLANAFGMLREMEATIGAAEEAYLALPAVIPNVCQDEGPFNSGALRFNDLKVRSSQTALAIANEIMQLGGIAAYKNDSPFSVGRHLRDLHSAPIMINNDRLLANMAVLMMAERAV